MPKSGGRDDRPDDRAAPAWVAAVIVALVVLIAPVWLWLDPLDGYSPRAEGPAGLLGRLGALGDPFAGARLQLDDFDYVAKSRTPADLSRHLLTPHNTHLVPLFRAWTFVWVQVAGRLERVPWALGLAGYLTYLAAMLLVGHLVAWESGRSALGLGLMAALGVSAVLEPTVRWFAAGQALLAGVVALAMLAALQRWRAVGGWYWLAAGAVCAASAPLCWSGGYVAGPAGLAYLWADGRRHVRRAAVLPLAASLIVGAGAWLVAGRSIASAGNFHDRTLAQAVNPLQGAVSTAQEVVEVALLRNLGLDAITTPAQALVLCLLLAAGWAWWRRRDLRPSPLEAAGAVLMLLGAWIVYTARGYFTFDSLRDLSWYQAIPQLGTALFAGGMLARRSAAGCDPPPRSLARPTRRGLLTVLAVVLVALTLQTPRVRARLLATAGPLSAAERAMFPVPRLQRLRARVLDEAFVAWQRRFLVRLDRAEQVARRHGLGRDSLRAALGRVVGPGMPATIAHIDGVNMMALPERDPAGKTAPDADRRAAIESVRRLLAPEPGPAA